MNPISTRQQYLKTNAKTIANWIKIYGQPVAVYRFISSDIKNIDKARRVFGSDRVTNNITRLQKVKDIKIPVAFDDLMNCHADRNIQLEFQLPSDELMVGDILQLDYLGQKLEFVVEGDLSSNLETLFRYSIRTRSSQNDLGVNK